MRKRNPAGSPKTTCSKCNKQVEESRKGQRYCKECHKAYQRLHRPKHRELSDSQRRKAIARSYVKEYIKRGLVKKKPCSICGELKSEAHHEDYYKPLQVVWFCRKHHMEHHIKNKKNDQNIRSNKNNGRDS